MANNLKIVSRTARTFILSCACLGIIAGTHAHAADSGPTHDAQVEQEILGQAEKMKQDARKGDTSIFEQMIAQDYAEFDPYFPFLADPPKSVSVAMEKEYDAYDKLPPNDRSHKLQKFQVYGDTAVLTYTMMRKGQAIGPGFMSQAKFVIVYVKMNGIWVLVYTHDGRRAGTDGLPID